MATERKVKAGRKNYMSDEAFGELRRALEDVLSYERGGRRDLRVTRVAVPRPPAPVSREEIVSIRRRLNCSQSVFAMMLNVSPRTVQAWEHGLASRATRRSSCSRLPISTRRGSLL